MNKHYLNNKMVEKLAKHPQFAKLAKKLRREGKSHRNIAKELEKSGFSISHQGVKNYLDKVTKVGARIIHEEDMLEQQAREEIINTTKQMRKINNELWDSVERVKEKINQIENAGDSVRAEKQLATILNHIIQQIKLSNKIMGKFVENQTVNISYLDLSTNITQHLQKLEKKGVIKILNEQRL